MQDNFSILVVGPCGAGKTTFIETIAQASGCLISSHGQTFCGQLKLDEDFILLPEVSHLHTMYGVLGTILGAILIVDSTRPENFREAFAIYATLRMYDLPVLVLANPKPPYKQELDEAKVWDLEALAIVLRLEKDAPIMQCTVTNRDEIKQALIRLLEMVNTKIEAERDDPESDWLGFLTSMDTVVSPAELFVPEREHRWIAVFGMDWAYTAYSFMDSLGAKSVWLRRADNEVPMRIASIDIDKKLSLYIYPRERFSAQRDRIAHTLTQVLALKSSGAILTPFEMEQLQLDNGVLAVVGIMADGGGRNARASYLVELTKPVPLILLDYGRHSPQYGDIDSLPQDVPRLELDSANRGIGKKSLLFLCDYLPAEYGERIRKKLNP